MRHHAKNSTRKERKLPNDYEHLSLDFPNLIPTHLLIYILLSTDVNLLKRNNYNADCYQCLLGARFVRRLTSKVVKISLFT